MEKEGRSAFSEKPNVPFACATGPACRTVDAQGREDRSEFDAAGRVAWTIQNFCDGSTTVEFTYAPDGGIATQTAKNSTTGEQVTQYVYGATLTESDVADTRLLRGVIYPDSDDTTSLGDGVDTLYDRVEHKYNRQGEVKETKDQNGTIHQFEFDLLGRQTADAATTVGAAIDESVRRIERGYEVRGMVERVTSYDAATGGYALNEVALSYDDFGLLSADKQEHLDESGDSSLKVQYAHANGADNHARLGTVTYPNGRVLHHEYSSSGSYDSDLGRVSYLSETNGSGTRYAAYTYLGLGRIVRVDCNKISDNDPTHSYNLAFGTDNDPYDGLDQFGRVIDLRWTNYAGTTDLVGIKHGYDRAGNRLWREDTVSKSQGTPVYLDELYAYDGMYQLTSLRRGQLNPTEDDLVADSKTFAEQWTLDPLGNWTNFKQDTDADSDWELDQTRTHNKANEIATITGEGVEVAHDAAGNMTRAPKPEDWGDHYHFIYDPWNRLVEVQTADQSKMVRAYEYDGLDRMIGKWSYDEDAFSLSEWRHYYYSDKWQFLEERVADSYAGSYSGSGIPGFSGWGMSGSGIAGGFRLDRQFVWGLRYVNDLVLRDRDTDTNGSLDERLYALQDPNWNVVAIANTSGTILKRFCYSAYGAPEYFTSDFSDSTAGYDWETLYSGYRYDYHTDSDVKWHIAGHRILLSHLGRWNRRDPVGYRGGWNPYHYCGNSPLIHTDPLGWAATYVFNSTIMDWDWFNSDDVYVHHQFKITLDCDANGQVLIQNITGPNVQANLFEESKTWGPNTTPLNCAGQTGNKGFIISWGGGASDGDISGWSYGAAVGAGVGFLLIPGVDPVDVIAVPIGTAVGGLIGGMFELWDDEVWWQYKRQIKACCKCENQKWTIQVTEDSLWEEYRDNDWFDFYVAHD